jgi:hypothetical protein
MKPFFWHAALAALAVGMVAFPASAQEGCTASSADPETAKMLCDLQRAAEIRERARSYYGARTDPLVQIIDTASPSGMAYVYDVLEDGAKMRLDARSVPDGHGLRCHLQATLPDDTANMIVSLLERASDEALPEYGPREEVTINPDGSRSLKMVLDSHDIYTRTETDSGTREFSRHAGTDDPVNRLNNIVIEFANVSPAWACTAS